MDQGEALEIQVRRLQQHVAELCAAAHWRDKLSRWHECMMLTREISERLERYENKLRLDFHKQTGLRASGNIWKKLGGNQNGENAA